MQQNDRNYSRIHISLCINKILNSECISYNLTLSIMLLMGGLRGGSLRAVQGEGIYIKEIRVNVRMVTDYATVILYTHRYSKK